MLLLDFFLLLAAILILQGLLSLAEGVRFHSFVSRSMRDGAAGPAPRASIIAPCKGVDPSFEASLAALFDQQYPDFEIVFALASADDPAREVLESVMRERPFQRSTLVIATPSSKRSEKISNLLAAIERTDPASEILVFVDSDALPDRDWLRALVEPLADPGVGASTGYRWYLPLKETRGLGDAGTRRGRDTETRGEGDGETQGRGEARGREDAETAGWGRRVSASPLARVPFWSHLLSAWNGSVATTLGEHRRNFAWGGSTAIRRETFDRLGVAARWDNAVSDDYVLTRAVQEAGLLIRFVPRCLLVSRESPTLKSLLEFTTRQVIITRVYRPAAWWVGLISHGLFTAGFFGGVGLLLVRLGSAIWRPGTISGQTVLLALGLALIYLLGCLKGVLRLRAASLALHQVRGEIEKSWLMFCVLWPAVSLVFLYNFIRSSVTRRITWRGVCYELVSDAETRVVKSDE